METILSLASSAKAFLVGDTDVYFWALCAAIALSYISSVVSAFISSSFSATKGLIVLGKKLLLFLVLIAGTVLDNLFGLNGVLRTAVITICVLNEFGGFISNLSDCGVEIPAILQNFINTAKASTEATDVSSGSNT